MKIRHIDMMNDMFKAVFGRHSRTLSMAAFALSFTSKS
jgi:hypothetical protein